MGCAVKAEKWLRDPLKKPGFWRKALEKPGFFFCGLT